MSSCEATASAAWAQYLVGCETNRWTVGTCSVDCMQRWWWPHQTQRRIHCGAAVQVGRNTKPGRSMIVRVVRHIPESGAQERKGIRMRGACDCVSWCCDAAIWCWCCELQVTRQAYATIFASLWPSFRFWSIGEGVSEWGEWGWRDEWTKNDNVMDGCMDGWTLEDESGLAEWIFGGSYALMMFFSS